MWSCRMVIARIDRITDGLEAASSNQASLFSPHTVQALVKGRRGKESPGAVRLLLSLRFLLLLLGFLLGCFLLRELVRLVV